MSAELDHDIQLLTSILTDVIERLGPLGHTQLCEQLLQLAKDGEQSGFASAKDCIAELSLEDIGESIKSLTLRFHLRNQAEKVAISRINRRRQREATASQPRRESIAEAVSNLKSRGLAYETVLELDPAYKGARYNLGLNAVYQGKLRDAIGHFKAEQQREPTSTLFHEMGRAYAKLGEPDSARQAYEQAIALDSSNASAYMWLGQLYEELGELDQALVISQEGLRLKPDNLDYKYLIGSLLFRTEHIEEAASYLEPVARHRSWHHRARYNTGQVTMRPGREVAANSYFARAERTPQSAQQIKQVRAAVEVNHGSLRYEGL